MGRQPIVILALVIAWSGGASGAQQPPVWTPASAAPGQLLTPLEGKRHDRFIEQAKAGDIDVVFFGTTDTEMWLWPDRGRSVWDRALGPRKAAGFGSQGTRFESLLWRMRNGELDGYQAKLVVLNGFGPGDAAMSSDPQLPAFLAGYAGIIAEVRARQPQARILLVASLPRGQLRREPWRQIADANAAVLAPLADSTTVFSINIGDRFFRADGSFNDEMWSQDLATRGRQTPAFEVWAQELLPWLDRFVR